MDFSSYWILFDDGNVLNNNEIRGKLWPEVFANYMMNRFGGSKDQWIQSNRTYFAEFMEDFYSKVRKRARINFKPYFQQHMVNWTTATLSYMNLEIPSEKKLVNLYKEITAFVNPRSVAPNPGIIKCIKELKSKNFNIVTSSGETSFELDGYLTGMGIKQYFDKLYGPDLINTGKFSSHFFQQIVNDLGISESQAILIEDNPEMIRMAQEIGINVIQSIIVNEKPVISPFYVSHGDQILENVKKILKK